MNNDKTVVQRVAAIQIRNDKTVNIEDLLMKLAMAESVAGSVASYAETCAEVCDTNLIPPDVWAVTGMHQALGEVAHALKCLCWGHEDALSH